MNCRSNPDTAINSHKTSTGSIFSNTKISLHSYIHTKEYDSTHNIKTYSNYFQNKVQVHIIFIELSSDQFLVFVSDIISMTFQEEPTSNHKEPTSQLRQISGGSVPTSEIHQINCQLQLNTITPFHQLPTKRHWFDPEFQNTFIFYPMPVMCKRYFDEGKTKTLQGIFL